MTALFSCSWVFPDPLALSCLFFPHIYSVGFQPGMSKRQGQLVLHWPRDCVLLLWLFCFSSYHLGALLQAEGSKLCQTRVHSLHSPCVCTCATWESALSEERRVEGGGWKCCLALDRLIKWPLYRVHRNVTYMGLPHGVKGESQFLLENKTETLWNLLLWDRPGWLFLCPVKWLKISSPRR